jgi:3-hydroxyisobutyrate dehydrogenase-like beta-hydroxyacid dehydrogenase
MVVEERENLNGFATQLANKDIRLVQEAAAESGLQLPLANLIRNHFEETITLGNGVKDVSSLVTFLRNKLS